MAAAAAPAQPKEASASPSQAKEAGKRRSRRVIPAPAKQSNTLDMWFKPSAAKAKAKDGDKEDAPSSSKAKADTASPAKPKPKRSSSKPKPLVQRRIHIRDLCRVCEESRLEEQSRCDLRCTDCSMTVHKTCYGVKDQSPDDDWFCNRCEFIRTAREERGEDPTHVDDQTEANDELKESLLPKHEPLDKDHKHNVLHQDCHFAMIFMFLKRFRHMGLKLSMDITLEGLANALEAPGTSLLLKDLLLRLLNNANATISKTNDWSVSLIRFLAAQGFQLPSADSSKLADLDYTSLPMEHRVAMLKFLCDVQFDRNDALIESIGEKGEDALRDEPVGMDAQGRSYWILEDASGVDAGAWICRGSNATDDGQLKWETVCDDLETLESFVLVLSVSTEPKELQLWQVLTTGILASMRRKQRKRELSEQRLARMPRLLGSKSDLDPSLILPTTSGRSLRTRKAVNYRAISESEEEEEDDDEEEGEEQSNASGSDEEEEDEQDEDEETRQSPRKKRKVTRAEAPPPTRSSRRLRGGSPPRTTRSSRRRASSSDNDISDEEEDVEEEVDEDDAATATSGGDSDADEADGAGP